MILFDPDLDPDPEPTRKSATTVSLAIPSRQALTKFLTQARSALRLRGQVGVLLTTDRGIRRLNRQFRHKDKATDVLSFPASPFVQSQEKGDLAISVHTARRQGTVCGHSLGTELKVLILHGLLHLAGYDHETDDGRMARRENALRARLGLPQGLIERVTPLSVYLRTRARGTSRRKAAADPSTRSRGKLSRDDRSKTKLNRGSLTMRRPRP
jgi:probable rRNA maturation factor